MMPLLMLDCGKSTPSIAGAVPVSPQIISVSYQAVSPMMTIVFSEAVTFTNSAGACRLFNFTTGFGDAFATLSGSGTNTLTGDINFTPGEEPVAGDILKFNYAANQGDIVNGSGIPLGEVIHFPVAMAPSPQLISGSVPPEGTPVTLVFSQAVKQSGPNPKIIIVETGGIAHIHSVTLDTGDDTDTWTVLPGGVAGDKIQEGMLVQVRYPDSMFGTDTIVDDVGMELLACNLTITNNSQQ